MMANAKTYSVSFRLRRTTVEQAFVSVPITSEMWQPPDEQGRVFLDAEKIMAGALHIGFDPDTVWTLEGEPVLEPHPIQVAPPDLPFPKPN
jgi:hypothetical protein